MKILVLGQSGASPPSGDYFRDTVDAFRGKLHSVSMVPSGNQSLTRTDKGLSLFNTGREMTSLYGPPDAQWNPQGVDPRYSRLNYYTVVLLVGTTRPSELRATLTEAEAARHRHPDLIAELGSIAGGEIVTYLAICPQFKIVSQENVNLPRRP